MSFPAVSIICLPPASRDPSSSDEDGLTILVIMRDGPEQGDQAWLGSVFSPPVSWKSYGHSR